MQEYVCWWYPKLSLCSGFIIGVFLLCQYLDPVLYHWIIFLMIIVQFRQWGYRSYLNALIFSINILFVVICVFHYKIFTSLRKNRISSSKSMSQFFTSILKPIDNGSMLRFWCSIRDIQQYCQCWGWERMLCSIAWAGASNFHTCNAVSVLLSIWQAFNSQFGGFLFSSNLNSVHLQFNMFTSAWLLLMNNIAEFLVCFLRLPNFRFC